MSDKGICADLVKRVERLERAVFVSNKQVTQPKQQDFCCVEEPPEEYLDVHISSPGCTNKLAAFYCAHDETWSIKASKSMGALVVLELPRTALQGVRWTYIKEGE